MTNFIEHLSSKIKEIVSTKSVSSESDDDERFENTLVDINIYLTQMGLNEQIIKDFEVKITQVFNDNLQDGKPLDEAFAKAFEFSNSILEQTIQSDSKVSKEDSNNYDLNFANTTSSTNTLLIDQAIAKGMTVEEAIKYVNNQQITNTETFGPKIVNHSENLNDPLLSSSMSKEEIDLSKIEADMDAQASNSRVNEADKEDGLIKDFDSDKNHLNDEDELG